MERLLEKEIIEKFNVIVQTSEVSTLEEMRTKLQARITAISELTVHPLNIAKISFLGVLLGIVNEEIIYRQSFNGTYFEYVEYIDSLFN